MERYRIGEYPRDAVEVEWEVFVRKETTDPLHHVGSVTAPSVDTAYEEAIELFGWYATDVWLCPATEMFRFSTRSIDENAEPVSLDTDKGGSTRKL